MFDHITLRVADLAAASSGFTAVLDELEIEQTTSTPSFSVWGNFALTQTDEEHPIARRVHIAFTAPTTAHVDRFAQAGLDAGFADEGPAGSRPDYVADYYAAFLKDPGGNSFEAVHRNGERPKGNIDHVAIRVNDVEASTAFYSTIGDAAGLTIRRKTPDRAPFSVGAEGGSLLVIAGEPRQNIHIAFSPDRATFSVGAEGGSLLVIAGEPTQNIHIAFSGEDDDVRRFHTDATAAGYRSNGEPGERPRYHDGYYAAFVLDPDRSNTLVTL